MSTSTDIRPATLADVLERTRMARNLNQAQASRQIGVPPTQYSRWKLGGGISMDHLKKVADWTGLPLAQLQPLAGYPIDGDGIELVDQDPRLPAIQAAWGGLSEDVRDVLHMIAVARARTLCYLSPAA